MLLPVLVPYLAAFWWGTVSRLEPAVVAEHPHDPQAFTQGLVWHEGSLYETTGKYGRSTLRQVSPRDGQILRQVDLPPDVFAEGLARVGETLIVLTWREQRALVYDLGSFQHLRTHTYEGEGWGLCHDGRRLVMSNGTSTLQTLDPSSFIPTGRIEVRDDNGPIEGLNELECVGDSIYANVWPSDRIVVIDAGTGAITAQIDGGKLAARALASNEGIDVFNGIAAVPDTDRFYVTGKLWPATFEVRFQPIDATAPTREGCGCAGSQTPGKTAWPLALLIARPHRRRRLARQSHA